MTPRDDKRPCDVCGKPIDYSKDDYHEASDCSGEVYHPACCPECSSEGED